MDIDETAARRRTWRRRPAVAGGVLLTTAVGMAGMRAGDDSPGVEEALPPPQGGLVELTTSIHFRPDLGGSGYIESVNDAADRATILPWHGPADDVQRAIREQARQLGVTVTVEQRRYSSAELDRAAAALAGRSGRGVFANFRIHSVAGVTADFDGVVVTGEDLRPPAGDRAAADAALGRAATAEIGVAVAVEPGSEIIPA